MKITFSKQFWCLLLCMISGFRSAEAQEILPGAANIQAYMPYVKDKKVALVINQTSLIGQTSLLDSLLSLKVRIVKIFVPEHGFRGNADAGALIKNGKDERTGLPVLSLHGDNKKPKKDQMADVDVVIYDLQDVGVRFYTYISTLQYVMESCGENNVQLLLLDRPNPNGHYVDGPVLNEEEKSFVGMQPVPVVYGMTAGEYAQMLVGEKWCSYADKLDMKIIPCRNYDHNSMYQLPVAPSPNLKSMAAVYVYPSMCFFEGTVISLGRGTDQPFLQWGHPAFKDKSPYSFTPESMSGATTPVLKGQACYGQLVAVAPEDALAVVDKRIHLEWLIKAYQWFPDKGAFFNDFFEKLAGTKQLRKQVQSGMIAKQIRATWEPELTAFRKIRKKYLLYKDFE